MHMKPIFSFLLFLWIVFPLTAQMPAILDLKQQGKVHDAWLEERIETLLPALMERTGIDMWILISKEYNEDAVLKTMLPSNWLSARRTTMLVIYYDGDEIETLACARYDVGSVFKKAWDKDKQPDQWARLAEIIRKRKPSKQSFFLTRQDYCRNLE